MTARRATAAIVGAVVGTVALWAVLRDVDSVVLGRAVGSMNAPLAVASLAATLAGVALVALRWKVLFRPDYGHLPVERLFRSVVISQMINIASPVRMGEVARIYRIAAMEGVPIGRVFATLAVEKILELLMFGATATMLFVMVAVPSEIASPRAMWVVGPLCGIAIVWAMATYGSSVAARVAAIPHFPPGLRRRLVAFHDAFATGFSQGWSARQWLQLLALSVGVLVFPAMANQLLFQAFGLSLPLWSGLLLLLILQVGSVPPSLPGRLGIFNYLTVVTLEWLGVDRVTAVSYSLVLYVIAFVPKLLLGALFLALPTPAATPVVPRSVS